MGDMSPRVGQLVRDLGRDTVGVYMGMAGPYFMLRPVNGGREWSVAAGALRPLAVEDVRADLSDALEAAGIALPTPTVSLTGPPVIELGRCGLVAAVRLATALRLVAEGAGE
ncbi:hypothetical protein [Streptomyces specialis]|uniref:hypothetical protein n=1 Tax=Streptomyces specialis TaxID=498367 RepID=UPI00073E9DE9|nr:hypothetical protein [Streptomyces specialis]